MGCKKVLQDRMGASPQGLSTPQRAQYRLIKECALNYKGPYIMI